MKIAIALSGSSGTHLGIKLINNMPSTVELHIIISCSASYSAQLENTSLAITHTNYTLYNNDDIGASLASGSFKLDKFVIAPCSMNTLAKCSVGICDNLITRAFAVSLKEKRDILIAPREMPLSSIALESMLKLSNLGVIIAPPILGYYSDQKNIDDVENFIIGKWLDLLHIENNLFKRWEKH